MNDQQVSGQVMQEMLKSENKENVQSVIAELLNTFNLEKSNIFQKTKVANKAIQVVRPFLMSKNSQQKEIASRILTAIQHLIKSLYQTPSAGEKQTIESTLKDLSSSFVSTKTPQEQVSSSAKDSYTSQVKADLVNKAMESTISRLAGTTPSDSTAAALLSFLHSSQAEDKANALSRFFKQMGIDKEKALGLLSENTPANLYNMLQVILENDTVLGVLVDILNANSKNTKWTKDQLRSLFAFYRPVHTEVGTA